ncbi:type IV secretion system protein [Altererythrobacter sp. H2]|uniref:type IV secretion system protein n=1 Tax=Altererythrobacter sp. H2 TaxID=3108391 RepID=UPI002B4C1E1B|nr:type IV secretion system protein [Altererythrobacter sp. H2]WRK96653.1 type IV secretion system protein [Altererythrobacter sp. H2]
MSVTCQQAMEGVGAGVAASLRAVDCIANDVTTQTFGRLFAPGGSLVPVLTILLTLYVAFFAISLLLGRSNLGVRALVPRMITLGLVLTFATSWLAYQSVVWNLAIGGPDWLATTVTGSDGSATTLFADKLDVVFAAIQQASQGQEGDVSAFSPAGIMWLGAMLLLLGTVGVLVTARIALAVLVALGPIFVVMALFDGTRGLFAGWLKGVVMLALTPVFAVIGGSVMLEIAVPVLGSLSSAPGQINAQAAMAFFLIGAVHCALMVMVIKVAGTMVGGWTVFGLARDKALHDERPPVPVLPQVPLAQPVAEAGQAQAAGVAQNRRIDVSAMPVAMPANDSGPGAAGPAGGRDTRIVTLATPAGESPRSAGAMSRTRGIGTRFRAPSPTSPGRLKEKTP